MEILANSDKVKGFGLVTYLPFGQTAKVEFELVKKKAINYVAFMLERRINFTK